MKKIKKKMLAIAIGTAIIGTSACKSNLGLSPNSFFDPFPLFWLKKRQDQKVEKVVLPCKIKDLQKEKDFLLKSGLKVEKWEILDDKGAEGAEIVLSDPNSGKKIRYSCIQTGDTTTECVGKVY